MANSILASIGEYENVVYAAGHEHNLQYFQEKDNHLIVSGSGSKVTHVGNSKDLKFGAEVKGYSRLSYYENGNVWLEYFGTIDGEDQKLLFSKKIYQKDIIEIGKTKETVVVDYSGKSEVVVGDSVYEAKGVKRFLMGSLNRSLWLQPITVPYLDIHKEKGGLNPIQVGGGMQSKSIRLLGGDGHQYVVRQIKKNTTFLVSKNLRNTFAQELVYDGIAGSHPFASIVIGKLSDPIGVFHTNPKLVFLPKDQILGDLKDDFGDTFCLFEERPNKDMSHLSSVGNSEKVIGYNDMVEKVHEKKNHRVDENFVLKSRLFDMIIGDWDRHDDQWRWASFKENGLTMYRPIPRDRDQAFFKFDGVLPKITNRKWLMRKFQNYGEEIRDIRGQNFNARYFDRSWMNQLNLEDWIEQAKFIKANLTDDDINKAIELFPINAQECNGDFLKTALKSRRDKIESIATSYYLILARSVKVIGKTGKDYFEVKRLNDEEVEVNVYPLKGKNPILEERFYHRIFKRAETKEILLYGLSGKDIYHIEGEVKKSILIRAVGGEDDDTLFDESFVKGWGKKTKYYDSDKENKLEPSKETQVILSPNDRMIQYHRKDFIYDTYMPLPSFGANPVDGFYLGAGITWKRFGFEKKPYKSNQSIVGNVAFKTGAFNLKYQGHFTDVLGPLDFGLKANANFPYIFDFNGMGNETEIIKLNLRRVRLNRIELNPYLALTNKTGSSSLIINAHSNNYTFDSRFNDDGIATSIEGVDDTFIGGGLAYNYVNVDSKVAPHRGIRFNVGFDRSHGLDDTEDINFSDIKSSLALYLPMGWMPIKSTLALRTGVKHVSGKFSDGEYNFYQSAFIGGQNEFRGVARHRYAGNTAQYNNVELRMDLRQVNNHTLPFRVGVIGHFDVARVWFDEQDSDVWHNSYGGGLYFDILSFITLNATYSQSDDGSSLLVQGGFFF